MDDDRLLTYLKRVTADLHRTRARLRAVEEAAPEPLAIVGMACRFPGGVGSPEDLWSVVADGRDVVGGFPDDRGWATLLPPDAEVPRWGGFLDGATGFDAELFGVSPREAVAMDPQQRLFLEVCWEAVERAGVDPASLRGTDAGVFAGLAGNDYRLLRPPDAEVEGFALTGGLGSVVSGRVAYALGLEGPAVTVDTACSSSLVALHQAGQALRAGECSLALAGGVTVMASPSLFVEFAAQGGLAADGRCKAFGAGADGTGWAEGVGVLVVERLSDARRHGRHIWGVVRGSAVNQDGASNGLTAPNGGAQQRVIRKALAAAGLSVADVDVVEAHGTGTTLGDPIEAGALLATYGQDRTAPVWLGSVKSNIGHTQAAAGVAGIIKMVMAMHHGVLPATLHAAEPSPHVDWDAGQVVLLTEAQPWPGPTRRAAVSSFGISGTNAHVVLESPGAFTEPASETGSLLPRSRAGLSGVPAALVVSAASPEALDTQARQLVPILQGNDLGDVAGALVSSRADLSHRGVVVASSVEEGVAGLERLTVTGRAASGGVGFVFSGQGAQHLGMGAGLYEAFPVYAEAFDEVCGLLDPGLRDRVLDGEPLDDTRWAQLGLFAVEVALVRLLASFGVRPEVVAGHSVGELVAAHVAEALSLDDACRLVAARARLMGELPPGGAMAAVQMSEAEVVERHPGVAIAAVNGPNSVVVSGPEEAVEAVGGRRLRVSHAFHSALVEPMLAAYAEVAATVEHHPPTTPLVSTLTGAAITEVTAQHWVDQARYTVRYHDAAQALADHGIATLLEVGPDGQLAALTERAPATSTLRRKRPDPATLVGALAHTWAHGTDVDWATLHPRPQEPLDLPTYPFQHQRYWPTPGPAPAPVPARPAPEPVAPEGRPPGSLLDLVRAEVAAILGYASPGAVDPDRAFKDLGFDSVTAVELRNRLNVLTGLQLPPALVFDHPDAASLAARLATELGGEPDAAAPVAAAPQAAPADEPLAIVGVACRYPGGVTSPEDLWDLVAGGRDAVGGFPADRGWEAWLERSPSSTAFAHRGGFLAGAAGFDESLFGISPREALAMDPQQRLLLEVSWEALERSGRDPRSLRGSDTGVFVGLVSPPGDYGTVLAEAADPVEGSVMAGVTASVASGRVAYVLGLEGPAVTVDTACSSSLVAMHLAGQALRAGECTLALAGGVTVMATPAAFAEFAAQGGLAADGRCKAFGAGADGTGWSEGVGVVVLERLSDARRHGHHVWAVVRGSAVNQDGASNGLTAPNGRAQQQVIRRALAAAGLAPTDVDAVEAHGTGTALGDPIEAGALLATYGQGRAAGPLWLGSLKSNIGHTQAAAGVAGVIKMVMAMRHGQLPATLHAAQPSPHVDWSSGAVELLTEAQPWPGETRRAAVSSFGMSGTNAHVILEHDEPAPTPTSEPAPLSGAGSSRATALVVSAASPEALQAQAQQLAPVVESNDIDDVAWSLVTSRPALEHRLAVVASNADDAAAALRAGRGFAGRAVRSGPVFVFPGQGAQWVGMGAGLMGVPAFREALAACEAALAPHVDWSLTEVVAGPDGGWLDRVDVVQPALFATMVALAAVWDAHGVAPVAVVGHSQGEIAAAHVAGALSLDDAARIVAVRARLVARLAGQGGMVSLAAGEARVQALLDRWAPGVGLAAVNGPAAVTVSGDPAALDELLRRCEAEGVRAARIPVDYAAHSPAVEALHDDLVDALAGVVARAPRVPLLSTVTGEPVGADDLDPGYWYRNLRAPVRFGDAVRALAAGGHGLFVEVSPHPVLVPAVQDTLDDTASGPGGAGHAVGTLRRDDGGEDRLVTALAEAWSHGATVAWRPRFAGRSPRPADLPTYPFRHRRYWPTPRSRVTADPEELGQDTVPHPLLGAGVQLVGTGGVVFTGRLSTAVHPWLADHVLGGDVVVPGAAVVELAGHAGRAVDLPGIDELVIEAPLVVPDPGGLDVQVEVAPPGDDGRRPLTVHARPGPESPWHRHATATLGPTVPPPEPPAAWPPPGATGLDAEGFYDDLAAAGLVYGPAFRGLRAAWRVGDVVYAEVVLDVPDTGFAVHPARLDAALHALALTAADADRVRLPFVWAGVAFHGAAAGSTLRVRLAPVGDGDAVSLLAADESGRPVVSVASLVLRRPAARAATGGGDLYAVRWEPLGAEPTAAPPERWAVVGDGLAAGLRRAGVAALPHPDLLTLLAGDGPAPDVVLVAAPAPTAGHDMVAAVREGAAEVLGWLQSWLADDRVTSHSRLVVVTRGAVDVDGAPDAAGLAASPLWGLVRSAETENPGRFGLVDLDPGDPGDPGDPSDGPGLVAAVTSGEAEVAVRGGRTWVRRLAPAAPAPAIPTGPWRLRAGTPGVLATIAVEAHDDPPGEGPGPHEVRVGARAAGLNFRDVLVALGVVPADPGDDRLGGEGAGVVEAVGAAVTDLAPGDRVMGLLPGAMASSAVSDRRLLAPIPAGWTFAQAAAVPAAFLTAWRGLVDLAGLRAGESVLVHAAAGGVGMAAVQIARLLGAEVYATAAPAKHPHLVAAGVDPARIASSRDAGFRERFRSVDVVLNSLAGDLVDASLDLLADGGRFVEMGKTDIRDPVEVNARHPGVTYQAFDLVAAGPERLQALLAEVLARFAAGDLRPLPLTTWDVGHAGEAFRHMSQARHVGKIVLTVPGPPGAESGGTALVTGGTGGLGAVVARHLAAEHGVRHLVLASRRGPGAAGADDLVAELADLGATATVAACDVADRSSVAALLAAIPGDRPLRVVVHAAGALDDGVVPSLDADRLDRVLAPKVAGAWYLHELTRELGIDLDAFVLFSSAAGAFGAAGQANYAAANVFLDTLATHRRAAGLPAVALAWGFWAEASGMTGHLGDVDRARLRRSGFVPLATDDGLRLLDAGLRHPAAALVPAHLSLPVLRRAARAGTLPASWGRLVGVRPETTAAGGPGADGDAGVAPGKLAVRVAGLGRDEARRVVLDVVRAEAAAVLGHGSPEAVAPDRVFKDLGFDSLTAVELRNRLQAASGRRLAATLVFDHPTPAALADELTSALVGAPAAAGSATRAVDRGPVVDEPLAIVGMACRFPGGVASPEDLWGLVAAGGDATGGFPADRGWEAGLGTNGSFPRRGGFLGDAVGFDAGLFGVSPREAVAMDPQQRLFLEVCWEAVERAGVDPLSLRGTDAGVFAGVGTAGYDQLVRSDPTTGGADGFALTGGLGSVVSGRVAYALGLEGPALSVDTACSSSLVALHQAGSALRAGECSLALAGGVTVMASPSLFVEFAAQGGLAADGRCKAFGAGADGTGWAEGVGVLVVERLSDARRLGHRVWGVVRGSAVNQDGASNGLTAPNGGAQQRVIRKALAAAGLSVADVDVVEAHGTGTTLGDPIEASALLATYGQDRSSPVWLGSVKSNIGHTQAAAGVAGIIKMLMAMHHGVLPATLHAEEPSPHVDWSAGQMALLTGAQPWPGPTRRAAVSSFGISGTNAHVVLEGPGELARERGSKHPRSRAASSGVPAALVVSAASPEALEAQGQQLIPVLQSNDLYDVAGVLATGRAALSHRAVVVAATVEEAVAGLTAPKVTGRAMPGGVGFVFSGQGAQYPGMGAGLHEAFPAYAEAFDEVCLLLDPQLRDRVLNREPLDDTRWAQTALFAVEVALTRLVASFGVRPTVVAGHSVGELAAAHVAGVLSLPDACRLVAARARLMGELPPGGAMAAVQMSEAEVVERHPGVAIAAVNGPNSVVVSGPEEAVEAVGGRRLRVSHAFHSALVEPMLAAYAEVAATVEHHPPTTPLVSTLTGTVVAEVTAQHWVDQARYTVRYHDAAQALADHGIATLLEVGPDGQLAAPTGHVPATSTLRPRRPDPATLVTALAHSWAHGTDVDWATLHPRPQEPLDLPTYPFQHQRYWPSTAVPSAADWRYRIGWAPLGPTPDEPRLTGRWVVLTSSGADAGLAAWCVDALRRAGADAGAETVTDPASLGDRLAGVAGVVSVLATDASPAAGSPAVTNGLAVTLAVVQALASTTGATVPTLWCVTRGAVATGPSDPVTSPGQAAVWGLGRVAGLEHPELWGGLVDLPDRLDGVAARALLEALAAGDAEDQVAVRAGRRLARRLVRAPEPTNGVTTWTPSGTALVTGGTGALGAHVARWLAANGAAHLVLVSRRGADAPGAAALAADLAAAGAGVTLLRADVADRTSLAEALATLDPAVPPVRVIVHAAGVGEDRPLADLDVAGLGHAAGAKAGGARHLHELAGERWPELERFVVFSSGAAVWGGAAQGAYAAANAYVDALVEQRRADGRPATSVAWGPWAGSGMAEGDTGEQLRRLGVHEMGAERATRVLVQALAHHEVTLTVADIDWERFAPAFAAARRRPLLEGIPEAARALHPPADAGPGDAGADPAGTGLGRRLAGLGEDEATQAVVDLVRVEVAAVLAYAAQGDVDAERAFKDLGFDSVTAVELRNRLGAVTGLRLPATSVFDYPTPASLAREIGRRLVPHRSPRTPGDAALDHLDQVAAALVAPGAAWAPEDREQLRLGLRQLLTRLADGETDGDDTDGRQQVEEHLLDADDDELFAFIDRQLGTPDP